MILISRFKLFASHIQILKKNIYVILLNNLVYTHIYIYIYIYMYVYRIYKVQVQENKSIKTKVNDIR